MSAYALVFWPFETPAHVCSPMPARVFASYRLHLVLKLATEPRSDRTAGQPGFEFRQLPQPTNLHRPRVVVFYQACRDIGGWCVGAMQSRFYV